MDKDDMILNFDEDYDIDDEVVDPFSINVTDSELVDDSSVDEDADDLDADDLLEDDDPFGVMTEVEDDLGSITFGESDEIFADIGEMFKDTQTVDRAYVRSESGSVIPFKGKFFVGYLGLHPLILYKEDTATLMSVIKTYTNIPLLNKLILNMEGTKGGFTSIDMVNVEGFIPHMNSVFNHYVTENLWSQEDITLAMEIRQKVLSTWAAIKQYTGLINLCRSGNIEVSPTIDNIIRRQVMGSSPGMDSFNIVKLLTAHEDPRKVIESVSKRLIMAIAMESNKPFIDSIISSYQLIIEQKTASQQVNASASSKSSEMMDYLPNDEPASRGLPVNKALLSNLINKYGLTRSTLMYLDDKASLAESTKTSGGVGDYFESSYEYTTQEYRILEDMGFPVVIAGNEHQLKRRLSNPSYIGKEMQAALNNLVYIGMICTKRDLIANQAKYQMPETLVMF